MTEVRKSFLMLRMLNHSNLYLDSIIEFIQNRFIDFIILRGPEEKGLAQANGTSKYMILP